MTYIDVTNKKFNTARELKENAVPSESISSLQARKLIEDGEYIRIGNHTLRGDSDIRLHENKMVMFISRDGGYCQTIAVKKS